MTWVAVLFEEKNPPMLVMPRDASVRQRIDEAKNADIRQSRIYAYRLLERAYSDIFSCELPPLCFDAHGKPHLKDGKIKISVSHTAGACAVAFSESDVGVDVQSYEEMRGRERVLRRFVNESLQNLIKRAKKPSVSYMFYKSNADDMTLLSGRAEDFSGDEISSSGAYEAACWSALEAVLKCRGGFCEYKNAENLFRASSIDTHYLKEAAVSVAVL